MKQIKYLTVFFVLLLPINVFGGLFGPSNFYECILEEMPGVKNDPVAIVVLRKCKKKFPNTEEAEKKSPILGIKTAGECVLKYAKDVSSSHGAKLITYACYKLYPSE